MNLSESVNEKFDNYFQQMENREITVKTFHEKIAKLPEVPPAVVKRWKELSQRMKYYKRSELRF